MEKALRLQMFDTTVLDRQSKGDYYYTVVCKRMDEIVDSTISICEQTHKEVTVEQQDRNTYLSYVCKAMTNLVADWTIGEEEENE